MTATDHHTPSDLEEMDAPPVPLPSDAAAQGEAPAGKRTRRRRVKQAPLRSAGPRGWTNRGAGASAYVEAAPEWRATSVQVCGLWPFIAGSGSPMIGVPLGKHLFSGTTVCSDPINWFTRAKLISNPGVFLLGLTGRGKSTVVRRMATGLAAQGVNPFVFGDTKPDYVELIRALGGNVVRLGRGEGALNVLDPGAAMSVAARLPERDAHKLLADAKGRRLNMVSALIELNRQRPVTDVESLILDTATEVLDSRFAPGEATLGDLVRLLDEGPEELRDVTLSRGDDSDYRAAVDPLQGSVLALTRGALGETFANQTTVALDLSKPLCIDISGIPESDAKLQAAVLLACWAEGFAALEANQALADAGLAPQPHALLIVDELWRVMSSAKGMVARVDALTRLNRTRGVGQALITHTLSDMLSLADEEDRQRAIGFAERAGYMILGGLPRRELPMLTQIVGLSGAEADLLADWSAPASWDPVTGTEAEPPGRGRFLIKVGGRPGIPIKVELTASELAVNDTNRRWADVMSGGAGRFNCAAGFNGDGTLR